MFPRIKSCSFVIRTKNEKLQVKSKEEDKEKKEEKKGPIGEIFERFATTYVNRRPIAHSAPHGVGTTYVTKPLHRLS